MSAKRAHETSDDLASSSKPAQKPRLSTGSTTSILSLDRAALEQLPQETLVTYVLGLQIAYRELHAKSAKQATLPFAPANGAAVNAAAPGADDPKVVAAQAAKMASLMASGITSQMKWQPSCKTKGKKFTFDMLIPSTAAFFKLFNLQEEKKVWKQKKIPREEFEKITGSLTASMRYGYLSITSSDLTLKWDREENTFSISGLYGL